MTNTVCIRRIEHSHSHIGPWNEMSHHDYLNLTPYERQICHILAAFTASLEQKPPCQWKNDFGTWWISAPASEMLDFKFGYTNQIEGLLEVLHGQKPCTLFEEIEFHHGLLSLKTHRRLSKNDRDDIVYDLEAWPRDKILAFGSQILRDAFRLEVHGGSFEIVEYDLPQSACHASCNQSQHAFNEKYAQNRRVLYRAQTVTKTLMDDVCTPDLMDQFKKLQNTIHTKIRKSQANKDKNALLDFLGEF